MTATPANSASKPAKATRRRAPAKKAPAKSAKPAPPTTDSAGKRLVKELSHDDDTYSIKVLIARAGETAGWLERLDAIINGDQREWLRLIVHDDTVEVHVDNAIREARQLQTELRHLLAEIFKQRAKIPMSDDDDGDVTANL